jgi:hypothetical protein
MKNYLTIVLLSIITFSCCDDDNETQYAHVTHSTSKINLRVQDAEGRDLLNPENAGHYRSSDIEMPDNRDFDVVSIWQSLDTDYYCVTLDLDHPWANANKGKHYEEKRTSKITFGNNKADKVKALYEISYHVGSDETGDGTGSGYTVILQQAWFNGVKVYDRQARLNGNWDPPVIIKKPNSKRE